MTQNDILLYCMLGGLGIGVLWAAVKNPRLLFIWAIRGLVGAVFIWGFNLILQGTTYANVVGINYLTIGTIMLLGFPGILVLFGMWYLTK